MRNTLAVQQALVLELGLGIARAARLLDVSPSVIAHAINVKKEKLQWHNRTSESRQRAIETAESVLFADRQY